MDERCAVIIKAGNSNNSCTHAIYADFLKVE